MRGSGPPALPWESLMKKKPKKLVLAKETVGWLEGLPSGNGGVSNLSLCGSCLDMCLPMPATDLDPCLT
jgi:hypothetical protein